MEADEKDLITIIIPAYNAETHLSRAVESVQNQTYANLEILIIDDGSQDSTGEIADGYSKKDFRINVLHVPNGGESVSRNLGISHAKGDFIGFCDADDYMHPDMIEKMHSEIIKNNTDMAVCAWRFVDDGGNTLKWAKKANGKRRTLSADEAQKEFLLTDKIEGFCWNKIIKKELYEENAVKYDDRRYSFCDILANFRLINASKRVSYIGEALYDYYQTADSCTHTPSIRANEDYVEVTKEVIDFASKNGFRKEAKLYVIPRMNKSIYDMFHQRSIYGIAYASNYIVREYENFLEYPFAFRLYAAARYPVQSRKQSIVKAICAGLYYRRCKKYLSNKRENDFA